MLTALAFWIIIHNILLRDTVLWMCRPSLNDVKISYFSITMQILNIGISILSIIFISGKKKKQNFPSPLRNLSISDEHIKMTVEPPSLRTGQGKINFKGIHLSYQPICSLLPTEHNSIQGSLSGMLLPYVTLSLLYGPAATLSEFLQQEWPLQWPSTACQANLVSVSWLNF